MIEYQPSQLRDMAQRALVNDYSSSVYFDARRIPYGRTPPLTGVGLERDYSLEGAIEVRGYSIMSDTPLEPIEAALHTLPGVMRTRIIRGPQDWCGREKNLRPQVIVWCQRFNHTIGEHHG
jgi:hypothetical protein